MNIFIFRSPLLSESMNLNPFDLLILIGLSQGLLFGLVVLFGKLFKDKVNRFLAYSVIMISVIGLDQWLSSRGFDEKYYFIDLQHYRKRNVTSCSTIHVLDKKRLND